MADDLIELLQAPAQFCLLLLDGNVQLRKKLVALRLLVETTQQRGELLLLLGKYAQDLLLLRPVFCLLRGKLLVKLGDLGGQLLARLCFLFTARTYFADLRAERGDLLRELPRFVFGLFLLDLLFCELCVALQQALGYALLCFDLLLQVSGQRVDLLLLKLDGLLPVLTADLQARCYLFQLLLQFGLPGGRLGLQCGDFIFEGCLELRKRLVEGDMLLGGRFVLLRYMRLHLLT